MPKKPTHASRAARRRRPLWLSLLLLLRPLEWSKNAFVFLPALFYDVFLVLNDSVLLRNMIVSFVLFCLAASSVYAFNDIKDIKHDRQHPYKKHTRPIASGDISPSFAWGVFCVLSATCFLFSLVLVPSIFPFLLCYWLLMLAYSVQLKHWVIVDLFVIAIGFCLRVVVGAAALEASASLWMLATTLCIALFLAASKRRQEAQTNQARARIVLNLYSVPLIERYMAITAVCTLMFYSFFATEVRPQLGFTIPFVLFGFFRYLLLIEKNPHKDSPTDLLFSDKPLLLCVLIWALLSMILLWH